MMTISPSELQHENRIVWCVPLSTLPRYVRESLVALPRRTGLSANQQRRIPGRIVGYADLHQDAPADTYREFHRRVFWLKDHDPYEDGGAPIEAVIPGSVVAGQVSTGADNE